MSNSTWLHRISRRMILPLATSAVTPNHLTSVRLVSGLLAAACFALDATLWNWLGAALFLLSMLLDRADGELARLQSRCSRGGAFYDMVADAVCNTAVFLALGIAAQDRFPGHWSLVIAVIAGVSISLMFVQIIYTEVRAGQGAAKFSSRRGFDPDDALIIVPICIVAGYGDWLLIAAAICAPLALVIISLTLYRRRDTAAVNNSKLESGNRQ